MSILLYATSRCLPDGATRAPCVRPRAHEASLRAVTLLAIAMTVGSASNSAGAQQPAPTPATALSPHRLPSLALVEPATGAAVPQDRPTVVFRFAPGDSADPIDARSFAVSVDGTDQTKLFQVARDEAWGQLAQPPGPHQGPIASGAHQVAARICSIRGACTEVASTVAVVVSSAVGTDQAPENHKRSLLDLLLAAARKLLNP